MTRRSWRDAIAALDEAAGCGQAVPQTLRQAIEEHLQADDAELTRRLLARAALEHRSDDTAEVIAQRLAVYHAVTSPILAWYRDRGILVSVDAMRSAPEVGREILAALEAMRPSPGHAPAPEPPPLDLTSLGEAFGATGSAASTSE